MKTIKAKIQRKPCQTDEFLVSLFNVAKFSVNLISGGSQLLEPMTKNAVD